MLQARPSRTAAVPSACPRQPMQGSAYLQETQAKAATFTIYMHAGAILLYIYKGHAQAGRGASVCWRHAAAGRSSCARARRLAGQQRDGRHTAAARHLLQLLQAQAALAHQVGQLLVAADVADHLPLLLRLLRGAGGEALRRCKGQIPVPSRPPCRNCQGIDIGQPKQAATPRPCCTAPAASSAGQGWAPRLPLPLAPPL